MYGAKEKLIKVHHQRAALAKFRSGNGSEFRFVAIQRWLKLLDMKSVDRVERPLRERVHRIVHRKPRDELLNWNLFDRLLDAGVLGEWYRWVWSTVKPHSALNYRLPFPEAC